MPTVILTRTEEDNVQIAPLFEEVGIRALSLPMIEIRDLHFDFSTLPDKLQQPLILLTSAKGAGRWLALRREDENVRSLDLAGYLCVGKRSEHLVREGDPDVPVLIVEESGKELAAGIAKNRNGKWSGDKRIGHPILYPCSKVRRDETVEGLEGIGYEVLEVPLYEPILPEGSIAQISHLREQITPETVFLFFSPSAVQNFFSLWPTEPREVRAAAIGSTTGKALQAAGCDDIICPEHPTLEEMIQELKRTLNS